MTRPAEYEAFLTEQFERLLTERDDLDRAGDEAVVEAALAGLGEPRALEPEPEAFEPEASEPEAAAAAAEPPDNRRRSTWIAAGLALVACGVAALVWDGWDRDVASQATEVTRVELVYAAGDVAMNGGPVRLGLLAPDDHLRADDGRACLLADPGAELCFGESTSLELLANADSARGRFRLDEGTLMVAASAQGDGSRLAVLVGDLELRTDGGEFHVEFHDGVGEVRVHEGIVELGRGRSQIQVAAGRGHALDLESSEFVVSRAQAFADRGLSSPRFLWAARDSGLLTVTVTAAATPASVEVDGRAVGNAPLLSFVPAGDHELEVAGRGGEWHSGSFHIAPGEHRELSIELEPIAASEPSEPSEVDPAVAAVEEREPTLGERPVNSAESIPSAEELLRQARAAMKAKDWKKAAKTYRRLLDLHPDDPLAPSARIAVGNLELDHLGRPKAALRAYDGYLQHPGPLSAEARHGRIRALRALGRRDAEADAIVAFLRDHPQSLQAAQLRKRLAELRPATDSDGPAEP